MQKIVISTNNTGLVLSQEAMKMYLKLIGKDCFFYNIDFLEGILNEVIDSSEFSYVYTKHLESGSPSSDLTDEYFFNFDSIQRTDENIIKVIEELGNKAGWKYDDFNTVEFKVVEIPDDVDWYIDEYEACDGEFIRETSRTWS